MPGPTNALFLPLFDLSNSFTDLFECIGQRGVGVDVSLDLADRYHGFAREISLAFDGVVHGTQRLVVKDDIHLCALTAVCVYDEAALLAPYPGRQIFP